MPSAEIIAIGTELLLGEIQDTNTVFLARAMRNAGINLFRTMMVGDNPQRIALAIQEALSRSQIVITTGGLGPTVDDPTREAVAAALNVPVEYRPELWEQIQARFRRYNRVATENNKRQAFIPQGATPIENMVGTAPAFICHAQGKVVISLPGVPREMEYLTENSVIPFLKEHFTLNATIQVHLIHVAGMGESQVDELIGEFESNTNPTVGLAAHAGIIDVRITAKGVDLQQTNQMIASITEQIQSRLGDSVYGVNQDTLESVIRTALITRKVRLSVIECNLGGLLVERLMALPLEPSDRIVTDAALSLDELILQAQHLYTSANRQLVLAVRAVRNAWQMDLDVVTITPAGQQIFSRSYGGPSPMAPLWAVNNALDILRRTIPTHF